MFTVTFENNWLRLCIIYYNRYIETEIIYLVMYKICHTSAAIPKYIILCVHYIFF